MQENNCLKTPVVILAFNRPEKTQRVFNEIKKARPEKLFIVADGPRNETDKPKCEAVRNIINLQVDWPCQVFKKYADKNLGCKTNIASGIDWVFENVEEAIILEDDCLPEQTFFQFCQELLEKYKDNPRIMHISGVNFAMRYKKFSCVDSYYFSNIGFTQGWATWRRAWQWYDVSIRNWPEVKQSDQLDRVLGSAERSDYYRYVFDRYYRGVVDAWDSQWVYARWINGGLSIVPKKNLISNIGFDEESFHGMSDSNDLKANLPTTPMEFPLKHPFTIVVNKEADDFVFRYAVQINYYFKHKIMWLLRHHFPMFYKSLRKIWRLFKSS